MRFGEHKKGLILFGITFSLIFWSGFLVSSATDKSSFCESCHYMKPYYDNWNNSSHNMVECIDCHYENGFSGFIQRKSALLGESLKYLAGTYSLYPRTKVSDESCIECHGDELEGDKLLYLGNVKFSHDNHYAAPSRGIEMHCAACHSELVQGKHLAVTLTTCFYCHFPKSVAHSNEEECYICHGPPKDDIIVMGVAFSHTEYLDTGVGCDACHVKVTEGTGDVPRDRCTSCHLEQFEEMGGTEHVHSVHVTDQQIPCANCHSEIEHGKLTLATPLEQNCEQCHLSQHSIQKNVYIGIGNHAIEPTPDIMFLSGVSCSGCHEVDITKLSGGRNLKSDVKSDACDTCHGKGYDNLRKMWTASVDNYSMALSEKILRLEHISSTSNSIKTMVLAAKNNLEYIELDGSSGSHNIQYTYKFLGRISENIRSAGQMLGLPGFDAKRNISSKLDCASSCHIGIDWLKSSENSNFEHWMHLDGKGLDCSTCHSIENHGVTYKNSKDCMNCHHKEPIEDCKNCHELQRAVYSGSYAGLDEPDIMYDAEVGCGECHLTNSELPEQPNKEVCIDCHDMGYDEMFVEWQTEVKEMSKRLENRITEAENNLRIKQDGDLAMWYRVISDANTVLKDVRNDGSVGIHNYELERSLLLSSMESIENVVNEMTRTK